MEDTHARPCCPFLSLPPELRLLIYELALAESPVVTIGCAELVGEHAEVVRCLYHSDRTPYPGIPHNAEPIIERQYEPSLLSPINPAVIPLSPATSLEPDEVFDGAAAALRALLLVSKTVHAEVRGLLEQQNPPRRRTSLFLQYPYGLHILQTSSAAGLLQHARSVHLAGTYEPPASSSSLPPRAGASARFGPLVIQNAEQRRSSGARDSTAQLAALVRSLFPRKSGAAMVAAAGGGDDNDDDNDNDNEDNEDNDDDDDNAVALLELRIYYPGEDSYGTMMGDDASPISVALEEICWAAVIHIEFWRGRCGTGVCLRARPRRDAKRVTNRYWYSLDEGGRQQPPCGSWVVDSRWPEWQTMDDEGSSNAKVSHSEQVAA